MILSTEGGKKAFCTYTRHAQGSVYLGWQDRAGDLLALGRVDIQGKFFER